MILSFLVSSLITFTNPVIGINCPDPTLLDDRERSGWFYVYSTQSTACGCAVNKDSSPVDENAQVINLPVYRSRDLVRWEFVGDGFPDGRPSWVKDSRLWAPDISYIGGKYILHYALGIWGGIFKEGCGVAVSDSPEGPFDDLGLTVSWKSHHIINSIDPDLFRDDDGRVYLYWGSLGEGIHAIEMNPDGLTVKDGAKPSRRLSARNSEAAYMHKRGGKYYLFASAGSCCEGQKSTYHVIVGRSDSPLGPFRGPDGQSLKRMNNRYTALKADRVTFAGPGHHSGIVTDDNGQDWLLYHCYDSRNGWNGRLLFLGRVDWDEDGWPMISGGEPVKEGEAPCFGGKPHMAGAYTAQREPSGEEVAIFRKVTGEGDMLLTPLSVSTQVVAGLNYKFRCRYEDSARGAYGHCWVVIYKDLQGNATLTSIKTEE